MATPLLWPQQLTANPRSIIPSHGSLKCVDGVNLHDDRPSGPRIPSRLGTALAWPQPATTATFPIIASVCGRLMPSMGTPGSHRGCQTCSVRERARAEIGRSKPEPQTHSQYLSLLGLVLMPSWDFSPPAGNVHVPFALLGQHDFLPSLSQPVRRLP